MPLWLLAATVLVLVLLPVGLAGAGALRVRRYSRSHLAAQLAIAGRGLWVTHTPDGTWWRLRLRRRRCGLTSPDDGTEPPPDADVREPRRPLGSGPWSAAAALDPSER